MERGILSTAISDEDIFAFLRKFGRNTNSFLLAYGGCEWFKSDTPPGLVAYVCKGRTCMVAGDPLCAPEDTLAVLQNLSAYLGSRYQMALLLVSGWLVPKLKLAGYGAVKVGSDPVFDLDIWRPRGNRAKKIRSAVNLAKRSGVSVSVYRVGEGHGVPPEKELQACTKAWLASQRGFSMRFFSGIRPLHWAQEKRHFLSYYQGHLVGFVTCSPIYARSGWYIEDIVHQPEAPYGTTELLITTALQSLREEGFSVATTGIAPFADLEIDIEHPNRTRLLALIRRALTPFYNFHGVQHYKKKFAPSRWEPVYTAFYPDRIGWSLVLDIASALIPGGFLSLVCGWLVTCVRGLLERPFAVFRHLFLRLDPRIPLKRYHRFLDSLALGIVFAFASMVVWTIYEVVTHHTSIPVAISKLPHRWMELIPIISLFLAWRFLAMLARAWQVGNSDRQLKADDANE